MQLAIQLQDYTVVQPVVQQPIPQNNYAKETKVAPAQMPKRRKLKAQWTRVDGQLICQWSRSN
ncbi:MAG: hypothetical protein AAGE59_18850 [Cyanobacteria bacterium P01_F01_bin.86]